MAADVFFLVDLVQDVGVVTPLIRLLRRRACVRVGVLVTATFYRRDVTTIWQEVLERTCAEDGAQLHLVQSEWDVVECLRRRRGFLVSPSESSLVAHGFAHSAFACVPGTFVTVTLQHGFECVGFIHNRAHDGAYGSRVRFAANVVCSWFGARVLKSLSPDQGHKLYVAGPPSFVDHELGVAAAAGRHDRLNTTIRGIICENLHSVRLERGELKDRFIDEMSRFFDHMSKFSAEIVLRSHPAGRFAAASALALPEWVSKSEGALHETLDGSFDFGISAPSSVLLDMMKAGIPVAVWRDDESSVDTGNYAGLPMVGSAIEWTTFAVESRTKRDEMIDGQNRFLERFEIPANVSDRYLQLLTATV